jgi:hypothetical protein
MLQDVATSGQANLEETTDVQDASPSGNFSAPQSDLVRVTGDLRKFASAPAAVHVAPAGQVVPAQTGQGEWAPLVSTTRVQTIEEQEEMLNFLEGSVILAASAGSYRQYGNPRSVGSLEQRLRVWTKNGFLLRGDASQNSRL